MVETDAAEVAGINSRAELAAAEAQWQDDQRDYWMSAQQAQEYGLVGRIIASAADIDG